MKKLISFTVFVAIILATAATNSLQARGMERRPFHPATIVRAYPAPGFVVTRGYGRWNRRVYRPIIMAGYWARPLFYPRPVIRVRAW